LDKIELDDLQISFLEEFYRVTLAFRHDIKSIVYKKLRAFSEASDINYMTDGCIADIERILIAQLVSEPDELFNFKEQQRKLALFCKDKTYVRRYVLEATKSFCRKKQDYWTHGRAKADARKNETHKAKKTGRAARVHWAGDAKDINSWMDNLISSKLSTTMLRPEVIEALNSFLIKMGLNKTKIKCFWDRFDGMTFVEMARQDPVKSASADKYRKRFKRIIIQLDSHSSEFKEILLGRQG